MGTVGNIKPGTVSPLGSEPIGEEKRVPIPLNKYLSDDITERGNQKLKQAERDRK